MRATLAPLLLLPAPCSLLAVGVRGELEAVSVLLPLLLLGPGIAPLWLEAVISLQSWGAGDGVQEERSGSTLGTSSRSPALVQLPGPDQLPLAKSHIHTTGLGEGEGCSSLMGTASGSLSQLLISQPQHKHRHKALQLCKAYAADPCIKGQRNKGRILQRLEMGVKNNRIELEN